MKVPYPPTTMLIVAAIYLSVVLLAAFIANHMHGEQLGGRQPSITITH